MIDETQAQVDVIRQTAQAKAIKETEERKARLTVGGLVIYHDPVGTPHCALITAVWGPNCINVVFTSSEETKQDAYGRQIERATSVSHKSGNRFHGNYFRFEDEEPNGYTEAQQK